MTTVQHRARVDDTGGLLGFYHSDVYPMAPAGAVDITEDQYREWLDGQAAFPPRYYRLVEGNLVPYIPPLEPPTPQQSYAATLAAGLTVKSKSKAIPTTTLVVTPAQQGNLANVALYIQVNGKFPAAQESLPLYSVDGSTVRVSSTDTWMAIATAVADFVTLCDVALASAADSPWTAPRGEVTIS